VCVCVCMREREKVRERECERERERMCVYVREREREGGGQARGKYSLRDTEWGRRPSDSCPRQCSQPLEQPPSTVLSHLSLDIKHRT